MTSSSVREKSATREPDLCACARILLFDREGRELRDDLLGIRDRAREHEPDRMKETERDLLQAAIARGHRGLPDVSTVAPRPRHRFPIPLEGPRDGLLDRQDVGAGAQAPREGLDEVLRLDGGGAPEQFLDRLLLLRGFSQSSERPQGLIDLENREFFPSLSGRGPG